MKSFLEDEGNLQITVLGLSCIPLLLFVLNMNKIPEKLALLIFFITLIVSFFLMSVIWKTLKFLIKWTKWHFGISKNIIVCILNICCFFSILLAVLLSIGKEY